MAHFLQLTYVGYFWWSQSVQLDIRKFIFYLPEGIGVKFKSELRMMSTLQQQLITAKLHGFPYFSSIGIHIRYVGICMPWYAVKIAKFAIGNAHISSVNVAVYLPGYFAVEYLN